MDEPSLEDLAERWWGLQRITQGTREERKALSVGQPAPAQAADDEVRRRVNEGGATAVRLVLALAMAAPTEADLGLIGAGPLEDLLVDHGNDLVEQIDDLARREPRFRAALTGVWLSRGELRPGSEKTLSRWLPGPFACDRRCWDLPPTGTLACHTIPVKGARRLVLPMAMAAMSLCACGSSPRATLINDSASTVTLQFCPEQTCTGEATTRLAPHASLQVEASKNAKDSKAIPHLVVVRSSGGINGCILIGIPARIPLSIAVDPQVCPHP